jgi:uncharacterized protein (TIGR03790 family)
MSAGLMVDVDRRGRICPFARRCPVTPARAAAALVAFALGLLAPIPVSAQSGQHVAVVINDASADSVQTAEHYIRHRGIPAANVIRIRTSPDEVIDRSTFTRAIEQPIVDTLSRGRLQDQILYIVLTKGVPLRIDGTLGREGTTASVDSEVTLLYRRMVGETILTRGPMPNPYYLGRRSVAEARPFTHRDHDIFLVTRLDAFTAGEAMALVDRCAAPSPAGHVVLDQRGIVANRLGDEWLEEAASRLVSEGHSDRVLLGTRPEVSVETHVVGYYSWGSNDAENRRRTVDLKFVPGALAATFVSTDARTFREPDSKWKPVELPDKVTWFAGSSQSLTADLVRQGVSGVAGHVSEPYLQSVVRPEILFSAYLAGFNLAESFYLALPHLSWQTVIVGDPLCRIGARPPLTNADLDPGLDPQTEVPAWFAERQTRRAARGAVGASQRAVSLVVRADNLEVQGNVEAAQQALEEAIVAAPRMVEAHVKLGELYGRAGEFGAAIERYRATLALAPDHLLALNNLAYTLAVHRNAPAEALPLAQKAAALARTDGRVLDTLAWIEHLMGDSAAAAKRISDAMRRNPNHATIRLHAAFIYAAINAAAPALDAVNEALRLDPTLSEREDVQLLRTQLLPRQVATEAAPPSD